MITENGFTADQAALATTVLRKSIGLEPQRFSMEQFVGMISDEIEQLRGAGKTDDEISTLLREGAGVLVSVDDIRHYHTDSMERGRPLP